MMQWPSDEELSAAFVFEGAGEPTRIERCPALGPRALRVSIGGLDWLVRLIPETANRSVRRDVIAQATLRAAGVDFGPTLALHHGLVVPALAFPWPSGASAASLATIPAARTVATALSSLGRLRVERRGTLASQFGFVPRAPRWSTEILEGARRDRALAGRHGFDLGSLGERMLGLLRDRAPALDEDLPAVLVHGLLSPRRLWTNSEGSVTVFGWENACFGDLEQDWAPIVVSPALPDVAAGASAAIAAICDAPSSIARLEAHVIRFAFRRLSEVTADGWSAAAGREVSTLVEIGQSMLTCGWLEQRLAAARRGERFPPPRSVRAEAVTRWSLASVARDPRPERSEDLLCALALVELAGTREDLAEGLLSQAEQVLGRFDTPGPLVLGGGTDRGPDGSLPSVLADLRCNRPLAQPVTTSWLVAAAAAGLHGTLSEGVLQGTDDHITSLTAVRGAIERTLPVGSNPQARQELLHALLILAALHGLRSATLDLDEEITRFEGMVHRSAIALELPLLALSGDGASFEEALRQLPSLDLTDDRRMLPVVLLALLKLGPRMAEKVPPQVILKMFGV